MIVKVRWSFAEVWPFDATESYVIWLIVMIYVAFICGWQMHAAWIAR
jgi:hypothetical protein